MGKQIGTFIRQLREGRGLSQGDVAKLLNLKTAQSISNIERGVSPLPKAQIKRFADILGVKKAEIVTVVLREVQDRVSKAAGISNTVPGATAGLLLEETRLLNAITEKLRTAKPERRSALVKQLRKILSA